MVIAPLVLLTVTVTVVPDLRRYKGNRRRHKWARRGGLPSYDWAPFDIAGAQLYLDVNVLQHLWQEEDDSGDPAITRVTGATDPVGRADDPVNGHVARAPADTARPIYRAGPFLEFDGVNDRLQVHNSATAFNFCHQTAVCTVLMRIGVHADGAHETILDSSNGTGGNSGIIINRTSANKVHLILTRGEAGNVFSCISDDDLLDAMGVVSVEVRMDNTNGADITIDGGTETSCARLNAPNSNDAFANLTIGTRSSGSSPGELELEDILITDTYVSNADVTLWRAYGTRPASYVRQIGMGECAGWPWFNFHHRSHDLTDTANLWQDTGRSVAVASDNDPVRVVDASNDATANQDLGRGLTAPADGERPLWQDDGTGALFDGTDDDLPMDNVDDMRGGARTWVVIGRHDNVGSPTGFGHLWQGGSGYVSMTGDDYSGNSSGPCPNDAYVVIHPSTSAVASVCLGQSIGFNLVAFRRDGDAWTGHTRGGGVEYDSTGTLVDPHQATGLSDDTNPMDGEIVRFESWQINLTDEQLDVVQAGLVSCHGGLGL